MTETQAIAFAEKMEPIERLRYYMWHYCECLPSKIVHGRPIKSFEEFCDKKNIIKHDVGINWEKHGFASRCWINLSAGSLFHSIHHNLKIFP